jgi:hypothetical protein
VIKLAESSQQAILAVMMYVQRSTGIEATQDEIAAALKTYFSLDEITNQISYLRRKPPEPAEAQAAEEVLPPRHRFNLAGGRPGNNLARAGYFIEEIGAGIAAIRAHAAAMLGKAPGEEEIARSLKSSFILSELKNQIVHARKAAGRRGHLGNG